MHFLFRYSVPILFGLGLTLPGVLDRLQERDAERSAQISVTTAELTDAPLSLGSRELLETAFDATARMPLNPHAKTRARIQEEIVGTCLALDQPLLAQRGAATIENWRRGVAYADLALYCVEKGLLEDAKSFLTEAADISENPGDKTEQSWRRDRIRTRIAKAYRQMGDVKSAKRFEDGNLHASVNSDLHLPQDEEAFAASMEAAETIIKTGDFEYIKAVLEGLAAMHARDYSQTNRRQRIETLMTSTWKRIPVQVRVEMTLLIGEQALEHDDSEKALAQISLAKQILDEIPQSLDTSLPLQARLIHLRFDAGQEEVALREAQAQWECFQGGKHQLADIYRAETLRPLAETYTYIGKPKEAAKLFEQVIKEGLHNPNSRPRLEDTVATGLSMARLGMLANDPLRHAIQEAFEGLGNPW